MKVDRPAGVKDAPVSKQMDRETGRRSQCGTHTHTHTHRQKQRQNLTDRLFHSSWQSRRHTADCSIGSSLVFVQSGIITLWSWNKFWKLEGARKSTYLCQKVLLLLQLQLLLQLLRLLLLLLLHCYYDYYNYYLCQMYYYYYNYYYYYTKISEIYFVQSEL